MGYSPWGRKELDPIEQMHTYMKRPVKTETEVRIMGHIPRNAWSQKLEEPWNDVPPEPSEGALPCQHHDVGLLVSRTVRE